MLGGEADSWVVVLAVLILHPTAVQPPPCMPNPHQCCLTRPFPMQFGDTLLTLLEKFLERDAGGWGGLAPAWLIAAAAHLLISCYLSATHLLRAVYFLAALCSSLPTQTQTQT